LPIECGEDLAQRVLLLPRMQSDYCHGQLKGGEFELYTNNDFIEGGRDEGHRSVNGRPEAGLKGMGWEDGWVWHMM
jgi:hypothetical protein